MSRNCPQCQSPELATKFGYFVRGSDQQKLQRFKCKGCNHVYSQATFQSCYRQRKRRLNPRIKELLCSGVSQRRTARLLKITRRTVCQKFLFLSELARARNLLSLQKLLSIGEVQFDDLETIEHTKCKPLSITLAVEKKTRRILALSVSQMPAKGHLTKKAFKKYGVRPDLRYFGRMKVFFLLSQFVAKDALFESDQNPHYPEDLKRFFPQAHYKTYPGQRGSVAGQGELKKIVFDPLFSLNHTCAMLRANINRLFRRTWCTTKLPERLKAHLELYTSYHNEVLLRPS